MLFTQFSFIFVFLPITLAAYYWAPTVRSSLLVLIAASLIFYAAWNYMLVPVLMTAIVINYAIARRIESTNNSAWFLLGLALALIPLIYFKYSGFFMGAVGLSQQPGLFGEKLGSILPLGISFYTFQQIAYLADVKQKKTTPGAFIDYAFFKLFFPQLIAGPIVHYTQLVPQIGRIVDREKMFAVGLTFFAIGFVKKFFIADGFSAFSDPIFDATGPVSTQQAIMATLGYTFQLYFDFSGYSDMALGLARLFGFELPINFDSPYKARSMADFWRRWHMTLSRFLRDYVYIPLGGNRRGELNQYRNLLLTMLIGGLWHGAAWTFVVWGGLHGLALAINHLWNKFVRIPLYGLGWFLTFVLAALLWVLFRATSFDRALEIYSGLLAFQPLSSDPFWLWLTAGFVVTMLLPNSQQIAAWISDRWPANTRPWVASFSKRVGIYAVVSSLILYGLTALYYTTPLDRQIYSAVNSAAYPQGMSNTSGDFRNNLWSKELFRTVGVERVALTGSSFVGSMGQFRVVDQNGLVAVSQTMGMGGNGILNGARQVAAIASTHSADVIFLGVSPLNFGSSIPYAPFPGQCMGGISSALATGKIDVPEDFGGGCLPTDLGALRYWSVFSSEHAKLYQFRNFVRNLAFAPFVHGQPFPIFDITPDKLATQLDDIKRDINSAAAVAVPDPKNGQDATFKWANRQVPESLQPGGGGYVLFQYLHQVTAQAGIRLVVYETPTPDHQDAPDIYPKGFFENYQNLLRRALTEIGIEYIDMSRLYPWSGEFSYDFVHLQTQYREKMHMLLLSWLFEPDVFEKSGVLAGNSKAVSSK